MRWLFRLELVCGSCGVAAGSRWVGPSGPPHPHRSGLTHEPWTETKAIGPQTPISQPTPAYLIGAGEAHLAAVVPHVENLHLDVAPPQVPDMQGGKRETHACMHACIEMDGRVGGRGWVGGWVSERLMNQSLHPPTRPSPLHVHGGATQSVVVTQTRGASRAKEMPEKKGNPTQNAPREHLDDVGLAARGEPHHAAQQPPLVPVMW